MLTKTAILALTLVLVDTTAHAKERDEPTHMYLQFKPLLEPVPCDAAANTPVRSLNIVGGNGGPITWSLTDKGDNSDFVLDATSPGNTASSAMVVHTLGGVLQGPNVLVGPNGIDPQHCGQTLIINIEASQP